MISWLILPALLQSKKPQEFACESGKDVAFEIVMASHLVNPLISHCDKSEASSQGKHVDPICSSQHCPLPKNCRQDRRRIMFKLQHFL